MDSLKLKQPPNRTARSKEEALEMGGDVGYPLVVRPSYVLGGRAMEIVHSDEDLGAYMDAAIDVSNDSPVLLDHFLDSAVEVDVDAICDGESVLIGGIMEHVEQAGVHSGDSGCSLPPNTLDPSIQEQLRDQVRRLQGPLDIQDIRESLLPEVSVEDDEVLAVLHRVQRLEPIGVASRNPGECIRVQLKSQPAGTPAR